MALKELLSGLIAYNFIRNYISEITSQSDFFPKEISMKNTIRSINLYLLTNLVEYTTKSPQDAQKRLNEEILKHIIPKRPGRHYPRKTKCGKYRKYR